MPNLSELTEADILTLEAGPEMAALMGNHVLGWGTPEGIRPGHFPLERIDGTWYEIYKGQACHPGCFDCESIADAYEAEEAVPEEERDAYTVALTAVLYSPSTYWRHIHASPLDRCRALLLWAKRRKA